ncbi:AAA family ATPase [Streptomyces decoyicus]
MTLKLTEIEVHSRTDAGNLIYSAEFNDGLNVLAAPNSFGKSTLLQAITYALGLEGMFSASRKPPFGPALTAVADFPDSKRARVRESWVTLTVENHRGEFLKVKRFVMGDGVDSSLVQTWHSLTYRDLRVANQVDLFVRQPGAAVRKLGFHHLLANFIGWDVPLVPGFNSAEVPLYMEAIFPMFYVEQKSGWSGVTPRMPTYLRIRDVLRRSAEFTLGLSTLDRLRALTALRSEEEQIKTAWKLAVERLVSAAESINSRLAFLQESPVTPARRQDLVPEALMDSRWLPTSAVLETWREQLRALSRHEVVTAGSRTAQARRELAEAEQEVRQLGADLRLFDEQLSLSRNDLDMLAGRLAALDEERARLLDLRKLRSFGSILSIETVAREKCPTCGQDLDEREVATGMAASLDESLSEVEAERGALISVRVSTENRRATAERDKRAIQALLDEARQRVRFLRDELSGPSAAPSKSLVQEQIRLENNVEYGQRLIDFTDQVNEALEGLAERWQNVRDRIKELGRSTLSAEDERIVSRMQSSFRGQVAEYGLRSVPPNELSIDPETLVPVNDGVELAFDLSMAISASDMIRTKWAYYVSLFEASKQSERGRHANLLIFDEPRQQETDRRSLSAFAKRLSSGAASGCQVIYATSEDPRDLAEVLRDIDECHFLPVNGAHLLTPA